MIEDNQLSIPEPADERRAPPDVGLARKVGQRPAMAGRRIVVILASFGERYLSTPMFSAAAVLPARRDGQL